MAVKKPPRAGSRFAGQKRKFSDKNYYYFVGIALLFPIIWAAQQHSWFPIIVFLVFGVTGMLGEILFSEWWSAFFDKPFYKYSTEKIVYAYSSKLNFIPWGIGGLASLGIISLVSKYLSFSADSNFSYFFVICFFACYALQLVTRVVLQYFHPQRYKFKHLTVWNYLFFCLPFLLAVTITGLSNSKSIVVLAIILGIALTLVEYLFGKTLEFLFGRKFWTYFYESSDHGHFTPLAIIPFSFLGFYFWGVYGLCNILRGMV